MDIRMIVSDIDRTILPANQQASPATIAAVRALEARGIPFVVASGRWFPAARLVAVDQLGIENGYMIVCNGGAIVRTDGTIIREYGMSNREAQTVYDILSRADVMMTAYVRGAIYRIHTEYLTTLRLPEASSFFQGAEYSVINNDEEAFGKYGMVQPYKMEAYSDDIEKLARLRAELEEAGLQANSSFPVNLEIMTPGTGKGRATRELAEYLGLERDQLMGFGDYSNDLDMLKNVGWPVAVGNALDEVKRAARIIAPDCDDDGVAKIIHQYVLGDEAK